MEKLKFALGDDVSLVMSGEQGKIIGRAEMAESDPLYQVRYKAADGRQVQDWLNENALVALGDEANKAAE